MENLKPCPFCGESEYLDVEHLRVGGFAVVCGSCDTHGPVVNECDAATGWNERAEE